MDRCRKEAQVNDEILFHQVDSVYIDGKKDATLVMREGSNGKFYRAVEIEEHYAIVGEPGNRISTNKKIF